ncbi:AAA family ATPase [Umezawaea endophytica]|uniref:Nuclease SbcCD subunit C n=1 Tax=Umezawaea endophytica TaxID=1654476 RepID=A0A9X2VU67_9PSEU|nr:AAA family ATPase [Umezawaea endophytica]MCS7482726.1 AAA family ATPase [Umezawaea endophytica]
MTVAESGLHGLMLSRVERDRELTPRAAELVIAACRGESALNRVLDGVPAEDEPTAHPQQAVGGGIYLSGVRVRGFRGIGPEVDLPLVSGPGLTVVTGRNGSGKSSFAEAAEFALTGNNTRWTKSLNEVWRQGWRNLHAPDDVSVSITLVRAGTAGATTIRRAWTAGDDFTRGTWTEQRSGQEPAVFDQAKWRSALETYRPFLPYSELGKSLEGKPSELHDAVHSLLGLEAITDAQNRLAEHRKRLADVVAKPYDRRAKVREELAASPDGRAQRAAELLGQDHPDLDALADLALGTDVGGGGTPLLLQVIELPLPSAADLARCLEELDAALSGVTAVATDGAQMCLRTSEVLRVALELHEAKGNKSCPVCGIGVLDQRWFTATRKRAETLAAAAAALHDAGTRLDTATAAARSLCGQVPGLLKEVDGLLHTEAARTAWAAWAQCSTSEDPVKLRTELPVRHAAVLAAVDTLKAAAQEQIDKRDLVWRPMALALFEWHSQAERALADQQVLADVTEAESWIRRTAARLRSERIAPFAKESQRIWQRLRQQSNIDLGTVHLESTGQDNRRVELDVSVDGKPNSALAVMSQGELHAMALALFLPRAVVDESPFRFVVIDDPVQAMDPAKVDGLAQVLADVGLTRQVVVFTHDERLVEAVRRLRLTATVWEVCRGENSVVQVRMCDDPVGRYLSDARAMRTTDDLPEEARAELVASCCRSALETAGDTRFRQVRLARGQSHAEVEQVLEQALTTRQRMSLAVFDDLSENRNLLTHLTNTLGAWAVDVLNACRAGTTSPYDGDLLTLIRDTERLTNWLRDE